GKNSLNRLIRCVCGKKIGPDPRNFNQRVSLGRNDLLIRTFLSRFGIFSIFPMLLVVLYGVGIYLTTWFNEFITTGPHGVVLAMFPLIWVGVVCVIGAFSAWFHRCWLLVPLAPLSVVYVLLAYAIWIIYGLIAFFTGREPQRDKPTRYSALVEASTAYSQPSVTGTEKLSEA
ncbi:hypothetical protein ACBQ66_12580, partial [Escherichia coli]|nr:hypothetical protein [Escherichia coli]